QAECDERADVERPIGHATGTQDGRRAEAESGSDDGKMKFVCKPVESGERVGGLFCAVMRALAEAGSAEVEAENGKRQTPRGIIERLHRMVDDLVVHGSAAKRVRMAEQRCEGRIGCAV